MINKQSKGARILITLSIGWSVFSLILDIVALISAETVMKIISGLFSPKTPQIYPLLIAFRVELSLLITINFILLLLWKKEIEGKRFLWFIGLNYSTFLLLILVCLTLFAQAVRSL